MNKTIQANERITFYKDLPEVMKLKEFIDVLDKKYNVNSNDHENSFGIINPEGALISALYQSNILYILFGYSSDISHVPKYEQVPLTDEGILIGRKGEVGYFGNPFRAEQKKSPISVEKRDLDILITLREKARDEINTNMPKKPVFDKAWDKKDYDKILENMGYASGNDTIKETFRVAEGYDNKFQVEYSRCGSNSTPHFTTSFNGWQSQDKMDHESPAYIFYKKWNIFHLIEMTKAEYDEMCEDLNELKAVYR